MKFTHVWVEACLPYSNYRGSNFDNSGHRWLPLDPSFERNDYHQGIAVDLTFDYATYMSSRSLLLPHEQYERQVEDHIKALPPRFSNNTLADVGYIRTPITQQFDVLPASVAYEVIRYLAWDDGLGAEVAALPDKHRNTFHIDIANNKGVSQIESLVFDMSDVVLNRITLSFVKGSGDPALLASARSNHRLELDAKYQSGAFAFFEVNGKILCDFPRVPVVMVDGEPRSIPTDNNPICVSYINAWYPDGISDEAAWLELSPRRKLTLTIKLGETELNAVTYNNISSYEYHALQGYAFQGSDRLINQRSERLLKSISNTSDPATNKEETLGEFLHLVGLKYPMCQPDPIQSLYEITYISGPE